MPGTSAAEAALDQAPLVGDTTAPRAALGRPRAWVIYLIGAGALALAYTVLRGTPLHSGPAFNAIGVSGVVAIVVAVRRHRLEALPWLLIAAGQASFVSGDVLAYNYQRFFGSELPFPSIADGFYLLTYPLLIAGLLVLVRRRSPSRDRAALIDALIVATSAGALSWTLLIAPYAHDGSLSFLTKLTSIAYPVMDLAVCACVARLYFSPNRRSASSVFLTVGGMFLLGTDSLYGWALLHGGYETGGLLDSGWIVFYLLTAAAALHPSARATVRPARDTQYRLTSKRIFTLAACAIVAPIVLAVEGVRGGLGDVPLLAACSAAVFLMVFSRLLDLGRRHEAAVRRATVLAEAGVGLVDARSAHDVERVAESAGQEILGAAGTVSVRRDVAWSGESGVEDPEADLQFPLQGRGRARGVLVAEGPRIDADTAEALQSLANEVALALDGVHMADQLHMQRAEARFSALVKHSTDAILVVDAAGHIDYASPSTMRVLGEDPARLHGRSLVDLVSERDRRRVTAALAGAGSSMNQLEFEIAAGAGHLEVEAICTNLLENELVRGIVLNVRDVSERKDFERQLAHQAFHDDVTGLANRALFRDRVSHALERARRGRWVTVLFLDLDDFKTVNDTLGHQAGDELIRVVAQRITSSAREVDTAARLGGDEFAVLLEDDHPIDASVVAQRLLDAITEPITVEGRELAITASVGIATCHAGTYLSVDELLRDADVAMYAAKSDGKGVARVFEEQMHGALLDRLELKRAMQQALDRDEFELHYQPVVDLETGEFVSLEALIRWRHPMRGLVAPDDFIPLAEETGAIISIGRWALGEATRQAAVWQELMGGAGPAVCVNLSGRQFQEPNLVNDVLGMLALAKLAPDKLVIEITETVMIDDLDLAFARLDELKGHGIRIAVDDFGSGYSSLNYIRRFPIDILKIDRAFIADIADSDEVASLTRTILDLASILGVTSVAEGIETEAQLERLRGLGCKLGQGYLLMRAQEPYVIEQELRRRRDVPGSGRLAA